MPVKVFTPDRAKSKIDKSFKIRNWVKLKNKQPSNEWSHFRVLSIESKVRKLCSTQGFTLGANKQGPVVRSMVSANHWLSSIKINTVVMVFNAG